MYNTNQHKKTRLELYKVTIMAVMMVSRDDCTSYPHSGVVQSDSGEDEGPAVELFPSLRVTQSATEGAAHVLDSLVESFLVPFYAAQQMVVKVLSRGLHTPKDLSLFRRSRQLWPHFHMAVVLDQPSLFLFRLFLIIYLPCKLPWRSSCYLQKTNAK